MNFNIKEGPTVKVGQIKFAGNEHLSSLVLRRSMENLKPIGIPYSADLRESLRQTFDSSKLEEDTERVRQAYRDKGYCQRRRRRAQDPDPRPGRPELVHLPAQQGQAHRHPHAHRRRRPLSPRHHHLHRQQGLNNDKALRATFAIKDGDWFNATLISKGLDNLKKAYGQLGYINFGAIPKPVYDEQKKTVSLHIDIDEGKQFYVSRIEFQGNTITRDRVIRRELMLDEGQVYNSQLWEYSLLRLNQLEYFEPLKVDQDSEAHQDPEAGTVDLLLKVKEKGKNSIGLNGGVSGLSGAFLGVNYQTNNFLGLGETLSVQGNLGNVSRQFLFGFSQPYVHNRPLNVGFQIFNNKQDFNAAKNYQATTGQSANLTAAQQSLTQNYNQASTGLNFSVSYPLQRHAFQRVGFTYSLYQVQHHRLQHRFADVLPDHQLPVRHSGLQRAGRASSTARPRSPISTTPSTIRCGRASGKEYHGGLPVRRHRRQRPLYLAVRGLQELPLDALPHAQSRTATMFWRLRAQLGYIQGFGGDVAPPNNRFYAGGESELRGFDVRGATPYGYVPNRVNCPAHQSRRHPASRAIPTIRS